MAKLKAIFHWDFWIAFIGGLAAGFTWPFWSFEPTVATGITLLVGSVTFAGVLFGISQGIRHKIEDTLTSRGVGVIMRHIDPSPTSRNIDLPFRVMLRIFVAVPVFMIIAIVVVRTTDNSVGQQIAVGLSALTVVWSFGAIFVLDSIQQELNSYVSVFLGIEDIRRQKLAKDHSDPTPTNHLTET